MPGKAGIVGAVEPCRTSGRDQYGPGRDCHGGRPVRRQPHRSAYAFSAGFCHQKIRQNHMIEDRDIGVSSDFLCQEGFDVLAVDLDIVPAAAGIRPVRVLLDHQAHFFQVRHCIMKAFGHCQDQILTDDLLCIPTYKRQIVLRGLTVSQPGVEGIDTGRKTAGTLYIRLFRHQDPGFGRSPGGCDRRVAAGGPASYDQDVCSQFFLFHLFLYFLLLTGRHSLCAGTG